MQREVVCQNRGRGREGGWKARQKESRESAAATPRHLGAAAAVLVLRAAVVRWDLCVEMIDHATQGKVRRARARSDVPARAAQVLDGQRSVLPCDACAQ